MNAYSAALVLGVIVGCTGAPAPIQRDPAVFRPPLLDRIEFRAQLGRSCEPLQEVDLVLHEAISIGAPIYNAGSPLGCYRIYEGAAYKLLFVLGSQCPDLTGFLRAGLGQARVDAEVDRKAWTMRRTFDTILGEHTSSGSSGSLPF